MTDQLAGYAVQLFTPQGHHVATVSVPSTRFGVVCWRDRYFAAREGRYVEVEMFHVESQR